MRKHSRIDYYYRKAKVEGYRSRAAYKLKEINEKFKVMKEGDIVIDLGAAPGGWIQVSREIVGEKGLIIGVDLNPMIKFPWDNVKTIQADVTNPEIIEKIKVMLPKGYADVVLSDLSPKVSGIWSVDHARQIFLTEKALKIAIELLKEEGICVLKVFQGHLLKEFINEVKRNFKEVRLFKPKASRKRSAEIYIIAKKKISQHQKLPL
ncbi:MAG: RlmE family RNA methyltransferase [Candidatus Methanomethylicia archaeon]